MMFGRTLYRCSTLLRDDNGRMGWGGQTHVNEEKEKGGNGSQRNEEITKDINKAGLRARIVSLFLSVLLSRDSALRTLSAFCFLLPASCFNQIQSRTPK
ncbi:hypothetical protein VNO78_34685 [Psophocarpus tetragonolobus]|uniref:Uncharacterized protein n=1 Tax=Psophocarpus tetragonolobus TaxID=3891 RepID=A0AAN9RHD8_PSOTE